MRRTKIICTLGPAVDDVEMIRTLIRTGMDAARFNFSHGSHPEHLERLNDAGVDALIAADLGTFTLAGRYAPRCRRHVSTQASVCNYETARAWHDLGASRVILARELNLEEIRTIRDRTPPDEPVPPAIDL